MLNLGNKHSEIIILVYQTVLAIAHTIIFEPNANFTVLFYPNSTYNLTITYTNAYTYTPLCVLLYSSGTKQKFEFPTCRKSVR